MWYSAVELRIRQRAAERCAHAAAGEAAAARLSVSAPGKDRAGCCDRPAERVAIRRRRARAFQCRRGAGDRGLAENRAQRDRQEPRVCLHGRVSRPHARGQRDHVELSLSPALRAFFGSRALCSVPVLFPVSVRQEGRGLRPVLPETVRAQFRHRVQLLLGCQGRRIRVLRVLCRADSGHRRLCHSRRPATSKA